MCNLETGFCTNVVDPMCGENTSGEWSFDAATSCAQVCDWGGYVWAAAGPEPPGVNSSASAITAAEPLCYSGVVAAHEAFEGFAMVGIHPTNPKAQIPPLPTSHPKVMA